MKEEGPRPRNKAQPGDPSVVRFRLCEDSQAGGWLGHGAVYPLDFLRFDGPRCRSWTPQVYDTSSMDDHAPPSTMTESLCPQCGASADIGRIFCKKCGAALQPHAPSTQSDIQGANPTAIVMQRPEGLTIIGFVFLLMAIWWLFNLITFLPELLRTPLLLPVFVANFVISVIPAVALSKMKSSSRWLCIADSAVALVFIVPQQVIEARAGMSNVILAGLLTVFLVWTIRYLFQPHVKAAFRNP